MLREGDTVSIETREEGRHICAAAIRSGLVRPRSQQASPFWYANIVVQEHLPKAVDADVMKRALQGLRTIAMADKPFTYDLNVPGIIEDSVIVLTPETAAGYLLKLDEVQPIPVSVT